MKVKWAANMFSNHVAAALFTLATSKQLPPDAIHTARFVELVDRLPQQQQLAWEDKICFGDAAGICTRSVRSVQSVQSLATGGSHHASLDFASQ